jgi:hypothetical protein
VFPLLLKFFILLFKINSFSARAILKNCGMKTVAVRVKIVDVEKFSAIPGIAFVYGNENDCEHTPRYWSDYKGNKISDEPFKKGDVVYISVLYPVGCESSNNSAFEEREGVQFLKVRAQTGRRPMGYRSLL